ncbi:MAG TPA: HEAT repeat domain-containing protein [Pyrinomonadaceae bacterium]|nr:HEAT repeat domain-containing protein [Pyrinomonadaceae bacterium]
MKRKILFTVPTLCLVICLVWLQPDSSVVASRPDKERTIANIDFFGYGHFDVVKLRSVLPIQPGESFNQSVDWSTYRSRIDEAIRSQTGKAPTDVARVCCDEIGNSMIYIGVAGTSSVALQHKPIPTGEDRLPAAALKLNQETEEALRKAVLAGRIQQDHSNGYALSADPELRAKELQMRELALANEALLRTVLLSSSDPEHRAIAAQFLGYVNVSARQIADLTEAARDPDEGVRNNAVRAVGVIASSSQQRARMIFPKPFIALLKSDKWVDRNKGGWLLINLTESRDPKLLKQLRKEAMDALVEMARWQFAGHASFARRLLGRIAGIEEARLDTLIDGHAEAIIAAAQKSH